MKFIIVKKYKYIKIYVPVDHRRQGIPEKNQELLVSIRVPSTGIFGKMLIKK